MYIERWGVRGLNSRMSTRLRIDSVTATVTNHRRIRQTTSNVGKYEMQLLMQKIIGEHYIAIEVQCLPFCQSTTGALPSGCGRSAVGERLLYFRIL